VIVVFGSHIIGLMYSDSPYVTVVEGAMKLLDGEHQVLVPVVVVYV